MAKTAAPKTPESVPTAAQLAYETHRTQFRPLERSPLPHGQKDSPKMREAFLGWLRKGATASRAARECNMCAQTPQKWRMRDPVFAEEWKQAVQEGIARLEDEAVRRGVEGVDRPVFQGGECVGFVREYSDDLLKFMLAARAPERFGRSARGEDDGRTVEFTFNFNGPSAVQVTRSAAEVHAPADDGISDTGSLLPGPVLDNRSDDEGR